MKSERNTPRQTVPFAPYALHTGRASPSRSNRAVPSEMRPVAGADDSAAFAYTAVYLRFAEGISRVLQTSIEFVVTGHRNVSFRHGWPDGGTWTVQLMSLHGPGELMSHDIVNVGPLNAAHRSMTPIGMLYGSAVNQELLHLDLTYRDARNNEAEHYVHLVPRPSALAWAGAAIRQCQRAQAAAVFQPQGAPSGEASSPSDIPRAWHPLYRDLPLVTLQDVDLFEQDVQSYLLRSVPSLSGPYPASTAASPQP
ncbi:hypothetical protein PPN31114_04281 [Pandoraea pneumonica]|jgi:hypothetical protein|uniref:Uncharacterized protein n=1 Tax=Pandoraea pneumonica TaxID=2508299 RepID=A0A5E4Y4B2_9BURK|nr:hypothetical protein [Pandoraea pneumonica]VVE43440.1 hypothetical protein PPN31114_04281 [Pandoraea pneumonica]